MARRPPKCITFHRYPDPTKYYKTSSSLLRYLDYYLRITAPPATSQLDLADYSDSLLVVGDGEY